MKYIFFVLVITMSACSTTIPNKKPIGEMFPSVTGKALDGQEWSFPKDVKGKNVLLLIGYKQKTQFDIDRWLIGIDQKGYKVNVFEVPTIRGWVPRLISSKIDEGMRSGIPEELWKIVVTVYGDAAKIVDFTGNENPRNARVVVLDTQGVVQYVHDRGFSVPALNGLSKFFPSSTFGVKCPSVEGAD